MPAILVASKMKSGLPKPVHTASPIVHIPAARTVPQPCYLKFGNKVEVNKSSYASQIPLKSQNGHENAGDGFLRKKSSSIENGFDTQFLRGCHKEERVNLFSKAPKRRTRNNGEKLIKERSNLKLRRNFLTSESACHQKLWVLHHWRFLRRG